MLSEKRPGYFYNQSSVIPFRMENKKIKLLMISNRKRSRWIFPKGIIEPHLTPQQSAEQEAFEEAGIKGKIYCAEIGDYAYKKWGGVCFVKVYLLKIETVFADWPEAGDRYRIWVGVKEAEQFVREIHLKSIINDLDISIKKLIK